MDLERKKHAQTSLFSSLLSSVNILAPADSVLPTALSLAQQIIANSPDAVQSTKQALLLSQGMGHNEVVHRHVWSDTSRRVYKGRNIKVRQQHDQIAFLLCPYAVEWIVHHSIEFKTDFEFFILLPQEGLKAFSEVRSPPISLLV